MSHTNMKSKTLKLIDQYLSIINEQDANQDPNAQPEMEQPQDVQQAVDPNAQETGDTTMPLTSQGEDGYISMLIDAALYKPSPEEEKSLLNLQNVMQMKRYENAREEVLPSILTIIVKETQANSLRNNLNKI